MASNLELYESLDIIGNGSFGIIRKVKRKSDGMIFARKELNFKKMSERDRKQIVSEVNILKDLHHEHIVRYHDRHIDHDSGTLYILMEYCGGGDLSSVIQQAVKQNRTIPEDTVWNYFMQILLALHYCHHPNGHGRASSGGSIESDGKERRPQILHRDLKPDNVFLNQSNHVKLGDFGLSKALPQASFANTYVGTPYYMSPELMQEKAYDSKSDIWSLGCLIYELCALKPPFHEAKTHAELSVFIRNGRIPPLPRGYSAALGNVIKSMLTLNPAMRPSAAQLLQHERIDLAFKVSETEKMIAQVKLHKATAAAREREVAAREATLKEREAKLTARLAQHEADLEQRIHAAVSKREEELRTAVLKREAEVAASMQKREEEIMDAIRRRQEQINEAWRVREETMREAVEERMRWVAEREEEMNGEMKRLEGIRIELEGKVKALEEGSRSHRKERKEKLPFEEVKNILAPLSRVGEHDYRHQFPTFETPISQSTRNIPENSLLEEFAPPASAMKGVILTETGEPISTPTPSELAKLFVQSPKVGLNFSQIFDNELDGDETVTIHASDEGSDTETEGEEADEPQSPTSRRESMRRVSRSSLSETVVPAPPTRLRRPSIRRSTLTRPAVPAISSNTTSAFPSAAPTPSTSTATLPASTCGQAKNMTTTTMRARTISRTSSSPPQYDFSDEENLPSPFLRRGEKERASMGRAASASVVLAVPAPKTRGRTSNGSNLLRAVAAANSSAKAVLRKQPSTSAINAGAASRPSVASARRAGEEARRALHRS